MHISFGSNMKRFSKFIILNSCNLAYCSSLKQWKSRRKHEKIQVPQDDSITEGVNSRHPEKRKGIVAIKGGRETKMEKKKILKAKSSEVSGPLVDCLSKF